MLALLSATAVVLLPVPAVSEAGAPQGDEASTRYHLIYEAPAECPGKRWLLGEINRRIEKQWLAASDRPAGTLGIAVSTSDGSYRVRMTLADPWGRAAFRSMEAVSCDAALSDVAVAAVAAIESRLGPQPAYVEFGTSAGVDWRTDLLAWGGGGQLGLRWPSSRRSLWLGVNYWSAAPDVANRESDVLIRFRLVTLRIEFCPVETKLSQSLAISYCGSAETGLLQSRHAESVDSSHPLTSWASLGASPQLRWSGDSIFLQVGPRVDFLLYPRRLADRPRRSGQLPQTEVIHNFPLFGFSAMAVLGWKLP